MNFRGESSEIRILPRLIQEKYTLSEVKNQVLLFLFEKQTCLLSWSNKFRVLKAPNLRVSTLKYAPLSSKQLSYHKRCSSQWGTY